MQTGIQVLLIALIVWAGTELVQIGRQSAMLEERLTTQGLTLQQMHQELRSWNDTYYRKVDGQRELDEIEGRIDNLKAVCRHWRVAHECQHRSVGATSYHRAAVWRD